jgi:hypothetical protein
MSFIFTQPSKKNNKYVSSLQTPVKYFLSDVKIKSIHKFIDNKGYLVSIYIPNSINDDFIKNIMEFDEDTINTVSKQSPAWFNKSLSKEEVHELYKKTYCTQTHTIDVIVSYNHLTKYVLNNKVVSSFENIIEDIKDIKNLKKCIINCEIQHVGLYFYKENANHKWIIKSIDVTDTQNEAVYSCGYVKVDVEDKLQENMKKLKLKTDDRVRKLQETIDMLLASYRSIEVEFQKLQISSGKVWEQQLKHINENILNQEDKIKS